MTNRPVIQSLWIGKTLSTMEKLSISSFLQNGHPFHLYVYDEVNGVPEGVVVKDASLVVPPDQIFKYKDFNSYAGFANLFRYRLLLEKGAYWVDCDVVCLVPFQRELNYVFVGEEVFPGTVAAGEKPWRVNNCVIKAPVGSKIMEYCYNQAAKRNPKELTWGETGPELLTAAIKQFGMEDAVARPGMFCPIAWWCWERLILGTFATVWKERMKMAMYGSHAVHLWNEMWRRNGVDRNADFPRRSLFEQLKRRYFVNVLST